MTEGYYEEPMKWTLKANNIVYENDQGRDSEDESRRRKKWHFSSSKDCPKISNTVILAAFISYAILSLICLVFLIQASRTTSNNMSNMRSILTIIRRNISSSPQLSKPLPVSATESPKSQQNTKNEMCDNEYRNKCFRIVNWTSNMTLAAARQECRRINGQLANVYDYAHFSQIAALIKESMTLQWQEINAWTGMTVDPKTTTMYLSNYRPASTEIPFYPGKRYSQKYRFLSLTVRNSANIYARGMSDHMKTSRFQTALCEMEKVANA